MPDNNKSREGIDTASCSSGLTRKEFIGKLVKGAAATGALVAAPKLLDKFLIPAAYAAGSSCSLSLTAPAVPPTEAFTTATPGGPNIDVTNKVIPTIVDCPS